MLTKLEDQILLSVWKFQGKAYGINVYQHLEKITQTKVAILFRVCQEGLLFKMSLAIFQFLAGDELEFM